MAPTSGFGETKPAKCIPWPFSQHRTPKQKLHRHRPQTEYIFGKMFGSNHLYISSTADNWPHKLEEKLGAKILATVDWTGWETNLADKLGDKLGTLPNFCNSWPNKLEDKLNNVLCDSWQSGREVPTTFYNRNLVLIEVKAPAIRGKPPEHFLIVWDCLHPTWRRWIGLLTLNWLNRLNRLQLSRESFERTA